MVPQTYSGLLNSRLMAHLPWAATFVDLGRHALGRRGVVLVSLTAILAILLVPAVLHLATSFALEQARVSLCGGGARWVAWQVQRP